MLNPSWISHLYSLQIISQFIHIYCEFNSSTTLSQFLSQLYSYLIHILVITHTQDQTRSCPHASGLLHQTTQGPIHTRVDFHIRPRKVLSTRKWTFTLDHARSYPHASGLSHLTTQGHIHTQVDFYTYNCLATTRSYFSLIAHITLLLIYILKLIFAH